MSRAKLLRQYLTDYNKEVGKADDIYKEQYSAYKAKGDAYNAFITKVDAGQAQGLAEFAPGQWAQSSGGKLLYVDKHGNPSGNAPLVNNIDELMQSGAGAAWVRHGDGMASYVKRDQAGSYDAAALVARDAKVAEIQANPEKYYVPANTSTGYRYSDEALAIMMGTPSIGVMRFDTPAPEQNTPKAPTFTNNQMKEMATPTDDAAGIVKAQALGYSGNPQLKGLEPASRNSAFSNIGGDDPNNLKDKGVLARAIAGEI